jgi:hypothetical protein
MVADDPRGGNGLRRAIKETLRPFFSRVKKVSRILRGKHRPNYVLRRRRQVGERLAALFSNTVRYGPFKGLRLGTELWWGADTGAMLLGIYEQEILESLRSAPPTHRTFIDVGGANGYYAIGMLVGGIADFSYCFERSPAARKVIAANAALNSVSGRVRVLESADRDFFKRIDPAHSLSQCVVFVDIEGGEFEVLDESVFEAFKGAVIFIELHEWFFPDGPEKLRRLREAAQKSFSITELTTSSRDLSRFLELDSFSDDDRWVICSEGRGRRMRWWRLDPRA